MTGHAVHYRREVDGKDAPGADRDVRDATLVELVVAAQRGNRASFTTIYERFHRVIHAIALARVPVGDAGDVVQEVFAEVWLKMTTLREPAAFPGWIVTLARRRAIDHARKRRPADDATAELAVMPPPRAEAVAALHAILALPDTYRETIIMRLVEGLSGPDIAERTGMTPESVRVHLHRGMKLLRDKLDGGSP
ncbi:MAG TPA: sigma-70 family RNA polymerase sigma factor [Kofleriaceae bacterium]|nr:sigma-70 family RNA polymerase sigma factor [Kofleriaceae bacterium]